MIAPRCLTWCVLAGIGSGCASPTTRPTTISDSTAIVAGLLDPASIAGTTPRRLILTERMAEMGVTAASIAVVRANRIALTMSIGLLGDASPIPVTPSTLFQVASISKPLTAVATMRLIERGQFSLDDSVNGVLRSWKIPANEFTTAEPVRIRHLLSHSGGATNGAVGIYPPGADVPTLLQALDGLKPSSRPPIRIDFKPGTRERYAGGGYSILQQMLVDVTGESFPDLMMQLVLTPLEMRNSCYCQPLPDSLEARAAVGFDGNGKAITGRWWTLPEMAAGGLWSTANDLARFVIGMNESWSGDRISFLSANAARRMYTPNVKHYGLGFEIDTVGGEVRATHTGSNNGYRALMVSYPARGDGLVILFNGDGGADLRYEVARAAAALYGWPGYEQRAHVVNANANPRLDELTGTYRYAGQNQQSTFTVGDGKLTAKYNEGPPQTLYSEGPGLFFTLAGTTYQFERAADGRVASVLVTFDGGSSLRARR